MNRNQPPWPAHYSRSDHAPSMFVQPDPAKNAYQNATERSYACTERKPGRGSKPAVAGRHVTTDVEAILRYSEMGMSCREIGRELGVSQGTVSRHLRAVGRADRRGKR